MSKKRKMEDIEKLKKEIEFLEAELKKYKKMFLENDGDK
jgi:hypothetical protein